MTKGKNERPNQTCIFDMTDDEMTKESIVNNQGVALFTMGGVRPRFQTESQRKMWLRLRAKQDAKTEK
jgi:hypothetical protein